MLSNSKSQLTFLVLLGLISWTGCGMFGAGKKATIDKAVELMKGRQGEMIKSNPDIEKADFYPDESGNGVVIEYTYKKTAQIDNSFNTESAKKNLIAGFKENESVKQVLGQGIFFRFLFKDSQGKVIADTKLEASDL